MEFQKADNWLNREFYHWEPFYIGMNTEPLRDETKRLSWEGQADKILWVLDYGFKFQRSPQRFSRS